MKAEFQNQLDDLRRVRDRQLEDVKGHQETIVKVPNEQK